MSVITATVAAYRSEEITFEQVREQFRSTKKVVPERDGAFGSTMRAALKAP